MKVIEIYTNILSINDREYVVYQHVNDLIDIIVAPWAQDLWVRFSPQNKPIYDNTHLRGVIEEILLHDFNVASMSDLYDGIFNLMLNMRISKALSETDIVSEEKPKRRM